MSKQPEIITNRNASHSNQPAGISEQIKQEIRERAYELFEQHGAKHGHDMEDWMQAEAEVLQHSKAHRAA